MISFRLTADEYDKFRQLCFTQGTRSVSEMARAAVSLLLQQPSQTIQATLESRISELEGRVHLLALEINKLNHNGAPHYALKHGAVGAPNRAE